MIFGHVTGTDALRWPRQMADGTAAPKVSEVGLVTQPGVWPPLPV
jgi:hypothetical protein